MSSPIKVFENANNADLSNANLDIVAGNQYNAGTINIHNPTVPDIGDLNHLLNPVHDATFSRVGYVARCHPGTREALIANIKGWMNKRSGHPICWLNGPAGSGKSAVSQTIAEWCDSENRLAASFFFFRGAGNRSKFAHLHSTLVHQLSESVPATKPFIQTVLQNKDFIATQSLKYQFKKLMIEPMLKTRNPVVAKLPIWNPMVIIVDALDECEDKDDTAKFLKVVIDACRENRRFPFRVLFTSRVDEHIQQILETSEARSTMHTLALQDFDAAIDIRKFLQSRLATIYEQKCRFMRNVREPWPSDSELDALVEKASGSFILASTLINFIGDGDLPHEKLPMVSNSSADLDHLYTQILSAVPRSETFERAIRTIMLLKSPLSITSLSFLLQLEAVDILRALIGIQSIVMIPGSDDEPVRLFHTSLRDFMTTKSRSGDFFVDPPVGHFVIANGCLRALTISPETITFDGEVQRYACINWCHHFCEGLMGGENNLLDSSLGGSLMNRLTQFVTESFDCWVNTLILHSTMEATLEILGSVLSTLRDLPNHRQSTTQVFENVQRRLKSDFDDVSVTII